MDKIGKISYWLLFGCLILNMVPAVYGLIQIVLGNHASGFMFLYSSSEIATLDPKVLDLGDGFGALVNAVIIAYCLSGIGLLVAFQKMRRSVTPLIILAVSFVFIQFGSYLSDYYFGSSNTLVLHISSVVMILGVTGLLTSRNIKLLQE